jgi:hypothetical protein
VIGDAAMDLKALVVGSRETIAGTVYGTILVLSVLTAGAQLYQNDLWRLSVIEGVTVSVFFVAHVYANGLGESLQKGHRLTARELTTIAKRESSMLFAAVVPIAIIILGAVGLFDGSTALWLALGAGIAALTVQGVRYARLERLGLTGTIVTIAVNLALGLVIVGLKVAVAH